MFHLTAVAGAVLALFLAAAPPAIAQSPVSGAGLTALWANDGEDKVTRDELRATADAQSVINRIWNGKTIRLRAARNETASFNLVLEAGATAADGVSVTLASLAGPNGFTLASKPYSGNPDSLFSWTGRNIELFYVRYLQIQGIDRLCYDHYDERHIPAKLRRPFDANGVGSGNWADRPNHDKFYPDIAVPAELVPSFTVAAGENQSIWVDVFIPKSAPAGIYRGVVTVSGASQNVALPVILQVDGFTLPDGAPGRTMLYYSGENLADRYGADTVQLDNRHFMLAHRHRLSLVDGGLGAGDHPPANWLPRLDGTLFTPSHGYDGPGIGSGNGVYSIATYGGWQNVWNPDSQAAMWLHTNRWESWFEAYAPATERFLYLIDESSNFALIQKWAKWMAANPGAGHLLASMATIAAPDAKAKTPALSLAASAAGIGITAVWNKAAAYFQTTPGKQFMVYNGFRPATGSFCSDDDGVALRALAWAQFKRNIHRWFYWESTYYTNFQCYGYSDPRGKTNVFEQAQTFGCDDGALEPFGHTGWNYSNGDGVLFYPGTDVRYPADSYNAPGPFASLRMKHWRRGIEDSAYLALASAIDAAKTRAIVNRMVPKVLWEYGVSDLSDPTWVRTDISWSTDPDKWDQARAQLAAIILAAPTGHAP